MKLAIYLVVSFSLLFMLSRHQVEGFAGLVVAPSIYTVHQKQRLVHPIHKNRVTTASTTTATTTTTTTTSLVRRYSQSWKNEPDFEAAFTYQLRKNRRGLAYAGASFAYAAYAIQNVRLQFSKVGLVIASGHLLASGVAWILKQECSKDKLFLYTNKRWNLALVAYGLSQLAVVAIAGRIPGGPFFVLGPVLATLSGLTGYVNGVCGPIAADLKNILVQSALGLGKVPRNAKSAGYLGATFMLIAMTLAKVIEMVEILSSTGGDISKIIVPLARFGRLTLLSLITYSLKDGAERGYLDSSNFKLLNRLSSASLAAIALYAGPTTNLVGAAAAALAIYFNI